MPSAELALATPHALCNQVALAPQFSQQEPNKAVENYKHSASLHV